MKRIGHLRHDVHVARVEHLGNDAQGGLLADSAPTIIGAMIIAPLMSPIMSLAYGLAILNRQLISLSIITIAAGTILVVAIAFISISVFGMRVTGSEILSRTSPTLLDLGVAFAAGGAAAARGFHPISILRSTECAGFRLPSSNPR